MGSETSPDQSARDIAYTWNHRYWHALDNAKRCRRLARYIVTDERLCLGLQQLAAEYETLAGWLRRH
jgi:hypothetical protein